MPLCYAMTKLGLGNLMIKIVNPRDGNETSF